MLPSYLKLDSLYLNVSGNIVSRSSKTLVNSERSELRKSRVFYVFVEIQKALNKQPNLNFKYFVKEK